MRATFNRAAIGAAETRVYQSRRNVRDSAERARTALRAALTRPSTLALVAVASGIAGFCVALRSRPAVESLPAGTRSAAMAARRGSVRRFISRYQAQALAYVLLRVTTAWRELRSAVRAGSGETSNARDSMTTEERGPIPARHRDDGHSPSALA